MLFTDPKCCVRNGAPPCIGAAAIIAPCPASCIIGCARDCARSALASSVTFSCKGDSDDVFRAADFADVVSTPLSCICCCKRSCACIVGTVGALRTIELAGAGFCGAAVDDGDGFTSVGADASGLGCAGLIAAKTGVAVADSWGLFAGVKFLRAQIGAAGRFSIESAIATEPFDEVGQAANAVESAGACGGAAGVADSGTGVIADAGAAVMAGICRGAVASVRVAGIASADCDVSRTAATKGMAALPLVLVGVA